MGENRNRLDIGVFVCHIETEYVVNMCNGIIHAAEDMDANVIFFPGMYVSVYHDATQPAEYDYQINTVYDYARHSNIDILIISLGTIGPFIDYTDINSFLNKFSDMTIIILEEEIPNYHCLTIDNKTGFRDCLEHLIHKHGFHKICYVNGKHNNRDSSERLEVYLEVMKENGLPVEPSMTPYGNFSSYCDPVIHKLLDTHPDTEAICFANDYMTLAGYRVLKSRGLEIGRNIAVTGFDDIGLSSMADPALTTVKVSAHELAYRAVIEGIGVHDGKPFRKTHAASTFICRNSCCCTEQQTNLFAGMNVASPECIEVALNYIMFHSESKPLCDKLRHLISQLFNLYLQYDGKNPEKEVFLDIIQQIIDSNWACYIECRKLHIVIRDYLLSLMNSTDDETLKTKLSLQIVAVYEQVIAHDTRKMYDMPEQFKNTRWLSSGIIRDSLICSGNTDAAIKQMLDKLYLLGIKSSYLYLFDTPIIHNVSDEWHRPKSVELIAYHEGPDKYLLKDESRVIPIGNLFHNEYTEKNYRNIKTIYNLFINNEQFGLLICELNLELLYPAYSASLEISSALKYLNMNRRLLNISAMDELTRLYNRRGFFDKVMQTIRSHIGEQAVLFFADLDSLKIINDTYGHEEGDYALMKAAAILRKSFRKDDIISRLGGDEYICFALINEEAIIEQLKSRIKIHTEELNNDPDRPYYIEMSYGYTTFVCNDGIILEDMIKLADHSLYENKRFKRVNPFREQHKEAY